MLIKSMYASYLSTVGYDGMDALMEGSRGITLQGKVSVRKDIDCLGGIALAGGNMYALSSLVKIGENMRYSNSTVVSNATLENFTDGYLLPDSMTLFHPSSTSISENDGRWMRQ